ncbi:sensor histidine kinase [Ferroacidibacillus organovorans]|uniref:Oxygen sensor histidine kinase NreB n=1 Tax=Ferroacidibacillus organovorans TaxID=1765683 RepID=A0A162TT56_9BACL|nr:sensor histidine kinase [Ferroacidibacillus organovorans]KYP81104.1 two-component sensor histidine kinase [Ferroacidibacillus organovorans]OAG93806.1 histidine kinase [Ferroacidibacillus organovorans]OPG17371.1 sensor histidine kinase [Ferroacidibacillus organovorans]
MEKPTLPVYDQMDHGIWILEEERRRIARDLHDGPAQVLTNISMKLDVIEQMIDSHPEMAKVQVNQLHKRVGAVVNEIRHLIYDLRPIAIDEIGLFEAVKELCKQLEKNWSIPILMTMDEIVFSSEIAPAKQVAIYRLIKEILNNVKKHAKARTIDVLISKNGGDLVVDIKDNGIGFDTSYTPPGHYGIIGMKERAAYLGGTLEIHSSIGQGSTFIIQVPVYQE